MPTTYKTKDGIVLQNVPDGTPEAEIKARIAEIRAQRTQTTNAPTKAAPAPVQQPQTDRIQRGSPFDMVTQPAMAAIGDIGGASIGGLTSLVSLPFVGLKDAVNYGKNVQSAISDATRPDSEYGKTMTDWMYGEAETVPNAYNMTTGGLAGLVDLSVTGNPKHAADVTKRYMDEGSRNISADTTFNITKSPGWSAFAYSSPELAMAPLMFKAARKPRMDSEKQIANRIESGDISNDLAKYKVDGGRVVKNEHYKPLKRFGIEDSTMSRINAASQQDRGVYRNMLDLKRQGLENSAVRKQPISLAGESLQKRIAYIDRVRRSAGKELEASVNELRTANVPADKLLSGMQQRLAKMDIGFDPATGALDFSKSVYVNKPALQKIIQDTVNFMKMGDATVTRIDAPNTVNAYRMHQLKKYIDEDIDWSSNNKQGMTKSVQGFLKDTRAEANSILRETNQRYANANDVLSETIDVINRAQKIAGKDVDLLADSTPDALGNLTRRIFSNAQSGTPIGKLVDDLDSIARKYKGQFNDDVVGQVQFALDLDKSFGMTGRDASFQGIQENVINRAVRGDTGMAADVVVDQIKRRMTPDQEKAFRMLEDMLDDSKQVNSQAWNQ